jgi:glutamate synthase (NADPH/NADH) small chain
MKGDPVTIRDNEKEIMERAFEEGWVKPVPPASATGMKVAVIGSGPSGLACANQLNKIGHDVTVYEKSAMPGGLLMYGIPNMKLAKKEVVLRRIYLLEREGIRFITGADAGATMDAEKLLGCYDAVVLCTGAKEPRSPGIEGMGLSGVFHAVGFLASASSNIVCRDKNVVVVGGGDTGTDCVAAAVRQGCRSVIQLEIMPRPPLCRQADNPWPQWPRVMKTDYGHEEARWLFGEDPRRYRVKPVGIKSGGNGCVSAVSIADVEWVPGPGGAKIPKEITGTVRDIPADIVLIAMGFIGTQRYIFESFGLESDGRGNIYTGPGTYQTKKSGLFSAGDARRGQSLVVWAIYEGRKAAVEVNEYLKGKV